MRLPGPVGAFLFCIAPVFPKPVPRAISTKARFWHEKCIGRQKGRKRDQKTKIETRAEVLPPWPAVCLAVAHRVFVLPALSDPLYADDRSFYIPFLSSWQLPPNDVTAKFTYHKVMESISTCAYRKFLRTLWIPRPTQAVNGFRKLQTATNALCAESSFVQNRHL